MWVAIRAYVICGVMGLIIIGLIWCAGYEKGHASADIKCQKEQAVVTNTAIKIRGKQDEIIRNRPDDAAVIKRLREHKF